ncbi:peptidoglycan-binding protein [Tepidamorphus sp. 3E244]|uniref:peptidoglycan-binding protein n=1 Tax=Tepidamorphus sp. 3E244 TaxID=3385498 RepID=UPI0038FCDEB8
MAYSSARQKNFKRAARAAAREAGLSLEEWIDTLFDDEALDEADVDFSSVRRPATDDATAMRLLSHRLDSIESMLEDTASRGGKARDAEGDRLVRDLQSAMNSGGRGGRGLAGGLARVVGEDLPISRNAASDAMKEIGRRLDRLSASMSAAQKPTHQTDPGVARLERRLDDISRQLKSRQEPAKGAQGDAIASQTKRLEAKLEAMTRKLGEEPRAVAHARLASTPSSKLVSATDPVLTKKIGMIDNAVSQILKRQRDLDAQPAPIATETDRAEEIGKLRGDIAQLQARVENASGQISSAVEQRLENLSGQLDTATRGELMEIRKELRDLAGKVEQGTNTNISALREALTRMAAMNKPVDLEPLETRLQEVATAVSHSNERDATAGLAAKLDALTQRIEDIAAAAGSNPSATQGFGAIESQLAELGGEIRARAEAGPQALNSIAMQFDKMNHRLDELSSHNDTQVLESLQARIDTIAEQISTLSPAGGTDPAVFDAIQSRLDEIAAKPGGGGGSCGMDAEILDAMLERFAELAERIETISANGNVGDSPQALNELATQVARLAEMLEASDRLRPSGTNIDQAMGELVRRVEQVRTSAIDAAQHAAQEVVAGMSRNGANSADTMSINNLKHELNALRSASEQSNSRTEQTLEVMRDVLTTIVDRLGDAESEEVQGVVRRAAPDTMYAISPTAAAALDEEPDVDDSDLFEPEQAAHTQDMAALAAPRLDLDAERAEIADVLAAPAERISDSSMRDEAADAPLPVDAQMPMDPELADSDDDDDDFPIAPPSALAPHEPTRKPRPDPMPASERASDADRQDFIAAARRAAQKASAEGDGRSITAGSKSKPKARKSIVMISAALILVVGSLKLYNMISSGDETASDAMVESNATPMLDAEPSALDDAAPEALAPAEAEPTQQVAPDEPAASDERSATTPAETGMTAAPVDTVEGGEPVMDEPAAAEEAPEPASEDAATPSMSQAPSQQPRVIDMTTGSINKGPRLDKQSTEDTVKSLEAALTELPAAIGPDGLRRAAIEGDSAAQFEVASRYTQGRGVGQDLKAAADWYQRAAAQGLAPAQYRLGSLYEKGHGVTRDVAMAEMWYMRAADQGNRKAMHNLAVLNAQGAKGEADFDAAARWFRQAAEHGLRDSQFNLGILYSRGLGIEADQKEAYKWFAIAASQGDGEAGTKRDETANALPPEDLAIAKRMARTWEATPLVESANFVKASGSWESAAIDDALDPKIVVRAAQTMLNQLGYEAGPSDGVMGPRTRDAIKSFQTANGMIPTGIATPDLLTTLKKSTG